MDILFNNISNKYAIIYITKKQNVAKITGIIKDDLYLQDCISDGWEELEEDDSEEIAITEDGELVRYV